MIDRTSSDVVIIGGVAAGPKTGAALARRAPNMKIALFQREPYISYGSCGMPYFASGDVPTFGELTRTSYGVERNPDFFRNTKGFDVLTGIEVVSIDRSGKTVVVKDIATGKSQTHGYGTLVIATGACPKPPPFPVEESPLVRFFTSPDDAISFRKLAESGKIGSLVIVGGGYIGCELAEAATVWGFDTTIIEREPQLLPKGFDKEIAVYAAKELDAGGIKVRTGSEVKRIFLEDGRPVVELKDSSIGADFVFLCLGVRPESGLARDCGLEIGEQGGILVDERLRTSDTFIYAGGDCVEIRNLLTGERASFPLGSLANRHGRVIAENIAGNQARFRGASGAALVKICNINMGCVGLSETFAAEAGISYECVWGAFPDKPDYYPESREIVLKMIYDPLDGRLLGLQAAGAGDICRRIDVFSSMLQRDGRIDDLFDFEHGYAPPYSEAMDPLHHLASLARARSRGLKMLPPGADSSLYEELIGNKFIWLDIREGDKFEENRPGHYEPGNFIHIPLGELRAKIGGLDKNTSYVLMCGRGARSYQAWSILQAAGFTRVYVAGAGIAGVCL
mgnify:FL=1